MPSRHTAVPQSGKRDQLGRALMVVGIGGATLAALCCFAPFLVAGLLTAIGLGFLLNDAILIGLLVLFAGMAGAIKMVVDRGTRKVLGVSMHGLNAAEVVHEAAMGLRLGATTDDFSSMLHVYPTMSEALKIVSLSFTKNVAKMSCCAE